MKDLVSGQIQSDSLKSEEFFNLKIDRDWEGGHTLIQEIYPAKLASD
jgi:hypothetical protein